jgi:hypothetical protein
MIHDQARAPLSRQIRPHPLHGHADPETRPHRELSSFLAWITWAAVHLERHQGFLEHGFKGKRRAASQREALGPENIE